MSDPGNPETPAAAAAPAPPAAARVVVPEHARGLGEEVDGDDEVDRRLTEIEMLGEEVAIGWKPGAVPPLAPEVRFLHVSRTIHQLVTDRNRSVGIFLAVASILVAASTGLLNVKADVAPMVPLRVIQRWCFPATFAALAVLGVFISFLLIRARIGLIYEVAKLNVLLGTPTRRVQRVNPLSIFYVMHLLVVALGGGSAGLATAMVVYGALADDAAAVDSGSTESGPGAVVSIGVGLLVALAYIGGLVALYYVAVLRNTTDDQLDAAKF